MNGFEKRTEQKKQQVLTTTFQLMNSEKGIENVTINQIARLTGISKATIFKYFGSKEGLIQMVFQNFLLKMKEAAAAIIAENHSFEETFRALTQLKIQQLTHVEQRFYLDLMSFYTKKDGSDFAQAMTEYTQDSYRIMLALLQQGRQEGKVDPHYSDEFLLIYLQSMVEGIANPQIYSKALPYTAEWTEALLKGIAP